MLHRGRNIRFIPFVFWLLFFHLHSNAQEKKRIDIEQADRLATNEQIVSNAQRLLGNVRIRHNDILLYCDSAYTYTGTNRVDAFGNVRINQNDTLNLYARTIRYDGDAGHARAMGNVRLVNKKTTLYTDTLDYDLENNIGYYIRYGRIEDSLNVLKSKIGRYLVNDDIIWFYQQVEGTNNDYILLSDTVRYDTEKGIFHIYGSTTIKDSVNIIYAESGWYDTNLGQARLYKNPHVFSDTQQLKGDTVNYNRESGYGTAVGNVEIVDLENNIVVRGHNAWFDQEREMAHITDSALLILISKQDSLFLHADILMTLPDTLADDKIIIAYHSVRFYRHDIQGKSDSLIYFSRDSTVQMFGQPVLWSDRHQLAADYIEIRSRTDAPDELHLNNNAFIISRQDSIMFDQVKGKNMVGYLEENSLRTIEVDGSGQTIYYLTDAGETIGLNRAESSKLMLNFQSGKIHNIKFLSMPEGKLTPLPELMEEDRRLPGFDWKEQLRPVSRYDIYRRN